MATTDAITRLQRAIGYSGFTYDPKIDALIRRLAELDEDVVEDVAAFVEATRGS